MAEKIATASEAASTMQITTELPSNKCVTISELTQLFFEFLVENGIAIRWSDYESYFPIDTSDTTQPKSQMCVNTSIYVSAYNIANNIKLKAYKVGTRNTYCLCYKGTDNKWYDINTCCCMDVVVEYNTKLAELFSSIESQQATAKYLCVLFDDPLSDIIWFRTNIAGSYSFWIVPTNENSLFEAFEQCIKYLN